MGIPTNVHMVGVRVGNARKLKKYSIAKVNSEILTLAFIEVFLLNDTLHKAY